MSKLSQNTVDFRQRMLSRVAIPVLVFWKLFLGSWSGAADSSVVISEIFASPGDDEKDAEFVELFNRTGSRIDLSGWQLAGGVRFIFPSGSVIEPNGYCVIAQSPSAMEEAFVLPEASCFGPWKGRLSSEGEKIRVLDSNGREIDEVAFSKGFPWPVTGERAFDGDKDDGFLFRNADSLDRRTSLELVHPDADNGKGGAWRESSADRGPTPGRKNTASEVSIPTLIESVEHAPAIPRSDQGLGIVARVTPGSSPHTRVVLRYQVVLPGHFIPAWSAQAIDENQGYGRHHFYDGSLNPRKNPEFEKEAAWRTLEMQEVSPGTYEAQISAQPHRTLIRYRVFVESEDGISVRAPQMGDPSLNFASYVSDGIPDYVAEESLFGARRHSSEMLQRLPVYALISRSEDVSACMAYQPEQRLSKGSEASRVYNWEGALVYDGIVYDHIRFRLRGGNGRYLGSGKRSMKFRFNDGHYFSARDQRGKRYEEKWRVLECSKMFSNRMVGNFGLVDSVNGQLWRLMGVPAPHTHWFHFRVVDDEMEARDQWSGDFWGLMLAQEHYDKRFLSQHGLEKGNLYKLSDGVWGGESQARYIAPQAVDDFSDYDGIEYDLSDIQSLEWIRNRVNIDKWASFSAVKEAVRHYDFWPGANKNMVYYFAPDPGIREGKLWLLPYDHDDTWGPCWNDGFDCVSAAVYRRESILLEERNRLREFRDLVWQSDQLNPMIDDLALIIRDFVHADYDRWWNGRWKHGRENYGTLQTKVEDMKRFAWYGGEWAGGAVSYGGRARHLDRRAADPKIPIRPTVEFTGGSGYPVDALRFESSDFKSPAGVTYDASEWRLAVITPPAQRIDPLREKRKYEWDAVWIQKSGPEAPFLKSISIPPGHVMEGDLCRIRVRQRDKSGRWSHWSLPCEFTCSASTSVAAPSLCVISEIHYHPQSATAEEAAKGFSTKDFEWLELYNRGGQTFDLTGARFTKGIRYQFPEGSKLGPGKRLILVNDLSAFRLRYGPEISVHDSWKSGDALNNGGELIRLQSGSADLILCEVRYDDAGHWPKNADGSGHSLELLEDAVVSIEGGQFSRPEFWRSSPSPGGSPGK